MYDSQGFLDFLCNGFYVMYDGIDLAPWMMLMNRCQVSFDMDYVDTQMFMPQFTNALVTMLRYAFLMIGLFACNDR